MVGWAFTLLVLVLAMGILAIFGLAGIAAGLAKILLFAFVALFLGSALSRVVRGRVTVPYKRTR